MKYSVFTKPWKNIGIEALCEKIAGFGFDGVEFPIRPEYQVEPANAERDLPRLARELAARGLSIMSVASATDENIFAACGAAGVPIIRIMAGLDINKGFGESVEGLKKYLDSLQPLCEKYGVKVGVQNHFGYMIFGTMELRHLLEPFDPKHIGAVWDAAHGGLAGEIAAKALDIIWDKLILVNLKNAYWAPETGPETAKVKWRPYFTLGRYGMASYSEIAEYLKKRGYSGDICLPAEYTDEAGVEEYVREELAYVKNIFN